jgi:hypothetical protein
MDTWKPGCWTYWLITSMMGEHGPFYTLLEAVKVGQRMTTYYGMSAYVTKRFEDNIIELTEEVALT